MAICPAKAVVKPFGFGDVPNPSTSSGPAGRSQGGSLAPSDVSGIRVVKMLL